MSIVRSLIWLFDRNQERELQAEQKRWEQQFAPGEPDEGPPAPESALEATPPRSRCRVCGRIEEAARYCPECLADTLVPLES